MSEDITQMRRLPALQHGKAVGNIDKDTAATMMS